MDASSQRVDWRQALQRVGMDHLFGDDPFAFGQAIDSAGRVDLPLSIRGRDNWILVVTRGTVRVQRPDGTEDVLEQGHLYGHVTPLGIGGTPFALISAALDARDTIQLQVKEGSEFVWASGQKTLLGAFGWENLESVRKSLVGWGGSERDPFITFLREKQSFLFEPLPAANWPRNGEIELELYEPDVPIVEQGGLPDGLHVVVGNGARIAQKVPVSAKEGDRQEFVLAILEEGALFGELERPLGGRAIPAPVSVKAGTAPKGARRWLDTKPDLRTATLKLPYRALDALHETDPGLSDRLEDFLRLKLAAWWPVLGAAARATSVASKVAASLLQEAFYDALRNLDREESNLRDRIEAGSLFSASELNGKVLVQDFRLFVIKAQHKQDLGKAAKRTHEVLGKLVEHGLVELECGNLSVEWENLRYVKRSFGDPQRLRMTIRNAEALLAVAHGVKPEDARAATLA